MKIKKLFKYFSYTIFSNGITLLISSLVVFVIPKIIGVSQYSYWQLYTFFMMYVGILHFGWLDGIYLKFGGEKYSNLDKDLFQKEFLGILFLQLVEAIIIFLYAYSFQMADNRKLVIYGVALGLLFTNIRTFFQYILQVTTRIREYAFVVSFDRILYIILVILVVALGEKNFVVLIICDLVARMSSMCTSFLFCKDLIVHKIISANLFIKNIYNDISIGSKLLVANFASILVVGIIRYGIQHYFGVRDFGKVSLMLSISSFIMTFISAISLVLFPFLRRIDRKRISNVFIGIRECITLVLITMLLLYYPMMWFLPRWLPQYADSFKYMTVLFPMTVFDGKFELLSNTMMKTLRLEKKLLFFNLMSVSFSFLGTLFLGTISAGISSFVYLILIALASRSISSTIFVSKKLSVGFIKDISIEVGMVVIFLTINLSISSLYLSVLLFGLIYVIFGVYYCKKIFNIYKVEKNSIL
ncbi:lipopolysaccharide biosynthesis protein [Liquorilactobacillus nagelii]|uniref:lipopolysaccharide biosynthesis protein n=1 Tax=Liquorilactobacillus nagelii TaxID=82688 RepID=UPI0009FB285C|nr:hypothetical protein [Liquorilactobacillus nagelii]QYH54141.1 hypothetical protein G6O73_05335 [Liquorilactobacillus nagelii DSM 13675]